MCKKVSDSWGTTLNKGSEILEGYNNPVTALNYNMFSKRCAFVPAVLLLHVCSEFLTENQACLPEVLHLDGLACVHVADVKDVIGKKVYIISI